MKGKKRQLQQLVYKNISVIPVVYLFSLLSSQ